MIAWLALRQDSVQWRQHLGDICAFIEGVEIKVKSVDDLFGFLDDDHRTGRRVVQCTLCIWSLAEEPVGHCRDVFDRREEDLCAILVQRRQIRHIQRVRVG